MPARDDDLDQSAVIIDEIESTLTRILAKKRREVEREFQERSRREKEESDRKISQLEEEFARDKELLTQFRSTIAEYEKARLELRVELQARLEKAAGHQKEIERLTGMTVEELHKIDELSGELSELRRASETRAAELRARIQTRFGLILLDEEAAGNAAETRPPGSPAVPPLSERPASERMPAGERIGAFGAPEPEALPDLELEVRKLRRIKQLLENEESADAEPNKTARRLDPELPSLPEEPAAPDDAAAAFPEPVDMKMPEINQIIEGFSTRPAEPVPLRPEPAPAPASAPKTGLSFPAVFEKLEQYRKIEAFDASEEIGFFRKGRKMILDGESIIRSMGRACDSAEELSGKLASAESAEDRFSLQQELLNRQEILRKIVHRGIEMCETGSAVLPAFTAEVMNVPALRTVLDQLSRGNWSSAESLAAFKTELARLKEAFYRRITPPTEYFRSILDELKG